MATLQFVAGTLELRGLDRDRPPPLASLRWDPRAACHRAPAVGYADLVRALADAGIEVTDQARADAEIAAARVTRAPRPFQTEALAAWTRARGRGVVVLPTGAGKTQVAIMAIDLRRRSALVVAPTLDLVRQWYDILRASFATEVGVVGGGEHQIRPLTVTTYDSAYLHMEHLGARFGLVVFDECHHLPGASYALAARLCLAPYRLGLTATPERSDGREDDLTELIGPIVYQQRIGDLEGEYLAEYETVQVAVALSAAERVEYQAARAIYLAFLRQYGIQMSSPTGWGKFLMRAGRGEDGARAMRAYRRQRALAVSAPAKLDYLAHLLHRHRADRTLVFTSDNLTAYEIARRFLVPIITHQTKVTERSEVLERFANGTYGAIATSRVLNEGVDVPAASVAVVVSGSGSVREHVQRLGRILRRGDGKRAVLYELVTADTGETSTSHRRRRHEAYRDDPDRYPATLDADGGDAADHDAAAVDAAAVDAPEPTPDAEA